MTVADLISELQRLPGHLPVKVVMDCVEDAEGDLLYLDSNLNAVPLDRVTSRGGYVLIEGAEPF